MATEHVSIVDPNIHEPKGVAAASDGQLYIADGSSSGDWRYFPHGYLYYSDIGGTGTTYTTPTTFTVINPTTVADSDPREISHNSAGRLTYTGNKTMDFNLQASITLTHSSASLVDVEFQFYKNGTTAIVGGHHATAALSGNYTHVSLLSHTQLTTNDYVEVFVKSASGNVIVWAISLQIEGKV